jgi:hypothetical protein
VQPACRTGKKNKQLPTLQEVAAKSKKVESEEGVEILHFRESFAMQEIPYKKYTREALKSQWSLLRSSGFEPPQCRGAIQRDQA